MLLNEMSTQDELQYCESLGELMDSLKNIFVTHGSWHTKLASDTIVGLFKRKYRNSMVECFENNNVVHAEVLTPASPNSCGDCVASYLCMYILS